MDHQPTRPTWLCVSCDQPWPCPDRRRELASEHTSTPVGLGLLMAAYFIEAASDLPEHPAGCLYDRFFGWIRSR